MSLEEEVEGVLPINHKGGPGVSVGQCQQPVPSLWVGQHPYSQKGPGGVNKCAQQVLPALIRLARGNPSGEIAGIYHIDEG